MAGAVCLLGAAPSHDAEISGRIVMIDKGRTVLEGRTGAHRYTGNNATTTRGANSSLGASNDFRLVSAVGSSSGYVALLANWVISLTLSIAQQRLIMWLWFAAERA
mgnify:CR=1 FL=1